MNIECKLYGNFPFLPGIIKGTWTPNVKQGRSQELKKYFTLENAKKTAHKDLSKKNIEICNIKNTNHRFLGYREDYYYRSHIYKKRQKIYT